MGYPQAQRYKNLKKNLILEDTDTKGEFTELYDLISASGKVKSQTILLPAETDTSYQEVTVWARDVTNDIVIKDSTGSTVILDKAVLGKNVFFNDGTEWKDV